jgi:hypothetical protein
MTSLARETALATVESPETAPQCRVAPSMTQASISTVPAEVSTEPRPALKCGQSSSSLTWPWMDGINDRPALPAVDRWIGEETRGREERRGEGVRRARQRQARCGPPGARRCRCRGSGGAWRGAAPCSRAAACAARPRRRRAEPAPTPWIGGGRTVTTENGTGGRAPRCSVVCSPSGPLTPEVSSP